jgi:glucose/mannose-6-phosphate isomerase
VSDDEVEQAIANARDRAEQHDDPSDMNPARVLAAGWVDALPIVYTGPGLLELVGVRWRGQIQENAKHPAAGHVLPEMNHNEIMGYEAAPEALLAAMRVVVLRDASDHSQVAKRVEATRALVEPRVGGWVEVESDER